MTTRKSSRVSTTKVDPQVWRAALEKAAGDARRLEVVDEQTVIVQNRRVK